MADGRTVLDPSLVMVVLIMVLVDEHKDVLIVVLHAAACWWISSEKCFRCFCNLNTFLQLADREGATLRGVGGRRLVPQAIVAHAQRCAVPNYAMEVTCSFTQLLLRSSGPLFSLLKHTGHHLAHVLYSRLAVVYRIGSVLPCHGNVLHCKMVSLAF